MSRPVSPVSSELFWRFTDLWHQCGKGERHGDGTRSMARGTHCPGPRLSIRAWCLLLITKACILYRNTCIYTNTCFVAAGTRRWNSASKLRALIFQFLLVPLIGLRSHHPERLTGRAVLRTTVARGIIHVGKAAASFSNQPAAARIFTALYL